MIEKFFNALLRRNLLFLLAALLVIGPQVTQAKSIEKGAPASLEQSSVSSELWKVGFTFEGSEPTYNDLIGRIFDKGAFRSHRASDIYYIFPAPANRPTIQSAQFRVASKTGAYDGNVSLSLEILEHKTGDLQETVATAKKGWEETGSAWTQLALSDEELQVAPDEFLAFHFQLSGDKGGDLDIRPEFEVEMQLPGGSNMVSTADEPLSMAVWRSGFLVEGTSDYDAVEGRLAGVTAAFRSHRGVSDVYYVFPAPANLANLRSAKFYILNKAGSYEGSANLTLGIYDRSGDLLQTVSSTTIDDLEAVSTETWTPIALSDTATDLTIAGDEFLAARVEFDEGPAGDLDLRMLFEVEVLSSETDLAGKSQQLHLPIILKQPASPQ